MFRTWVLSSVLLDAGQEEVSKMMTEEDRSGTIGAVTTCQDAG